MEGILRKHFIYYEKERKIIPDAVIVLLEMCDEVICSMYHLLLFSRLLKRLNAH